MAATRKAGKPKSSASRSAPAAPAATGRPAGGSRETPHPLEWVVGAISLVLVLSLLAYLGFRGLSDNGRPPQFVTRVEAIEPVGDLFHVIVAVTNPGSKTAAGVIVEADLGADGEASESVEIEFDYLPAGSTRHGTFVFARDPSRDGELRLSVLGYTAP
jgi:uncharacterized protein (TIGR02588 family)